MNLDYLHAVRSCELDVVVDDILTEKGVGCLILEVGAGSGWQAKELFERGFSVEAIDIESSNYMKSRVWPITNYNGDHIPFPDDHFDVIYSSNVLEHIPEIETFQSEMQRVLKTDGIAIHVVPSGTWRVVTTLSHYFFVIKELTILGVKFCREKILGMKPKKGANLVPSLSNTNTSMLTKISKLFYSVRHGEQGNTLTEVYYFSKYYWSRLFTEKGWNIRKLHSTQLFYSGNMVFGLFLSIRARRKLSSIFGSSSHVYVLNKMAAKDIPCDHGLAPATMGAPKHQK